MNRDDLKIFLYAGLIAAAFLIWATLAHAADPPKLPAGVTCEAVRAKVAEHGRVYAYAWARLNGYSRAEVLEAKKCLR